MYTQMEKYLPERDISVLSRRTRLVAGSHVTRILKYSSFLPSRKIHGNIDLRAGAFLEGEITCNIEKATPLCISKNQKEYPILFLVGTYIRKLYAGVVLWRVDVTARLAGLTLASF